MSKKAHLDHQLIDNHGRLINYVRLSVTDRCNLRCFYCMPEKGMKFLPKNELLSFEEMHRLLRILSDLGISKVRITGGEPFVRSELMQFLQQVNSIDGIQEIHLTTNGVLTGSYVPALKDMGISSVNLSLDTLDPQRFREITRRDHFHTVMDTFHALLDAGIKTKINAVVIDGKNTEDIIPMVDLTKTYPVEVRFIEEMPFNGHGANYQHLAWDHKKIFEQIKNAYPNTEKANDPPGSTAMRYHIPGHQGNIGIIAAYSRTFCGSCNRIRITSQGILQTCLYGLGKLNLKTQLRSEKNDFEIGSAVVDAVSHRAKDGHAAEQERIERPLKESMSVIGG